MIVFRNKGLIDLRAIETMGLSAKPKSDNPIGEFGTGLKLAIAVILRNGGDITLYRGKKAYSFGVANTVFRGEDVQIVTMDGQRLGFTLNYGKNWKPWQAFREIYSNMLDEPEGECFFTSTESLRLQGGYTTIVVDGCDFDALYENRRTVFLEGDPIVKVPGLEVHFGASKCIYYNGMRAMDLPNDSLFTYNITAHMSLTEDRTFLYPHMAAHYVSRGVVGCDNAEIISSILQATRDNWESCFRYSLDESDKVSGTFMRVYSELKFKGHPLSTGAGEIFKQRARATGTYRGERLRQPKAVEKEHYEQALDVVRSKLPYSAISLDCMVRIERDPAPLYATREYIELDHNFISMPLIDVAVKVAAALCFNAREDEATAESIARAFLLGKLETGA